MKSDERSLVDEIFLAAVDLEPGDARVAFLDEQCGGLERGVRDEIDKLLNAESDAQRADFTLTGVHPPQQNLLEDEANRWIDGRYRLLQKLGEGGMGVVFMADQTQPVRRRVAIKLVKPGMDTEQVVARFEAERQALAMMEHPNIAKVLDVGTTAEGRPYFVMELVKGRPITEYCDENRVNVEHRLRLFLSVCQAVQHAHQKGIIHRDLKPSNVLVAEYDNVAVPKVIDFGLAKALQHALTEKTLFTQLGQVVGTFEYMSPEQAKLNQLDIDTRTDIYSLGVLLYELLTGHTPFDSRTLRNAAFDEMLRIIREMEPAAPSAKLASSQTSDATAKSRQMEASQLTRRLRGDLDAIAMKALDKERSRRYDSSSSLAEDIQRFLNDEPVSAARQTYFRYWTRVVKRHQKAVAVAGVLVLLLMTATTLWIRSMRLAEINRDLAEKQRTVVREDMRLAQAAWDIGDLPRVRSILNKHRPPHDEKSSRHFEWGYLSRLEAEAANKKPLVSARRVQRLTYRGADQTLFVGHASALSIDDERGTIALRDLAPFGAAVDFSPEGTHAVFATHDTATSRAGLVLFDLRQQRPIDRLPFDVHPFATTKPHTRRLVDVVFSPDGRQVATTHWEEGVVSLWQVSPQRKLRFDKVLAAPPIQMDYVYEARWIQAVAFNHQGSLVAAGGYDGIVRVWDVDSGRTIGELQHESTVHGLAFCRDDSQLIVASSHAVSLGMSFYCWDSANWQAPVWKQSLRVPTTCFALSPNGQYLALGSPSGLVRLVDARSLREIAAFRGHASKITHLEFSTDGRQLATADKAGKVFVWSPPENQEKNRQVNARSLVKRHTSGVKTIAFHPANNLLVSADADGGVVIIDADTQATVASHAQGGYLDYVEFLDDGEKLAFGKGGRQGTDGGTWIWDWEDATRKPQWIEACWMKSHRQLDYYFRVRGDWKLTQNAAIYTKLFAEIENYRLSLFGKEGIRAIGFGVAEFAPVRPLLTMGGQSGWVATWDAAQGESVWTNAAGHSSHVTACSISPLETTVATASVSGNCVIWDLRDGTKLQTLTGHSGAIHGIDYAPDGQTIATASLDGTVRLWDIDRREERFALKGNGAGFWSVRFSPDQTILAAADNEGVIWLWRP